MLEWFAQKSNYLTQIRRIRTKTRRFSLIQRFEKIVPYFILQKLLI